MSILKTAATLLALATLAAPLTAGTGLVPVNPVMNPGFEVYADTTGQRNYWDGALYWAHHYGSNAQFTDIDGDGDREAVVAADLSASSHNFWQSTLPPLQAVTANFDAFEFTLEHGQIPAGANIQIGLALSPGFTQHPWVGLYWEGAVFFTGADLSPDADGRVSMDPAVDGQIICPDWQPCRDFKAAFDAADEEGRHSLLGQARVMQVSFWNLNRAASGQVALDDVAIVGATTAVEEALGARLAPHLE